MKLNGKNRTRDLLETSAILTGLSVACGIGALALDEERKGIGLVSHDLLSAGTWIGGALGSYALLGVGKRVLGDYMNKSDHKEMQKYKDKLPVLENGISPQKVFENIRMIGGRDDQNIITKALSLTWRSYRDRGAVDNTLFAYEVFSVDIDRAVDRYAYVIKAREIDGTGVDDYSKVTVDTMHIAAFLDKVIPIADECPYTPSTSDPGKYWFDFIERRANQRADELLSVI